MYLYLPLGWITIGLQRENTMSSAKCEAVLWTASAHASGSTFESKLDFSGDTD
jgi:hypothetical protein